MENSTIYIYTRNGVEFVTPNIDIAFARSTDGNVLETRYHGSEY